MHFWKLPTDSKYQEARHVAQWKSNLSLSVPFSFQSRPTTPCSTCEKANGGVGSRCHRYDEECDDCRRAQTELNIASGSDDGRTFLSKGNAYEGDNDGEDDEENGEGSTSIGIKSGLTYLYEQRGASGGPNFFG